MAKYYLSILYKDKRGEITTNHEELCTSPNFVVERDTKRIYYDIPLDSILGKEKNTLEYIAFFTMKFNNNQQLQSYLINNSLMPEELINKRMNIYTTYKNERYGLETGIPYAKTKKLLNTKTVKDYYLKKFNDNKDAYFQASNMNRPLPVDYTIFSRLYRILETRYSRPNYKGTNKSLTNLYQLNNTMKNKLGGIGHKVKYVKEDLINVLNRELYLKSDMNEGINYHGLIVLANLILIHNKWLYNENVKAMHQLIDEAPIYTDEEVEYYSNLENKRNKELKLVNKQLDFFNKF